MSPVAAKLVHHGSHWGGFRAEVKDGRVVGVTPFHKDPNPSPLIRSIPDALYDGSRVAQPMIRKGWLDNGPGGSRHMRGAEPFVPVSWDKALDLVSAELARVKRDFGNEAIFAGSYGWSSAGRFHHAKSQLSRFMNQFGGYTAQLHNYSYAAGLAVLPHIVGSTEPVAGPISAWDSMVGNTKLVVAFGGMPLKNAEVDAGGNGEHTAPAWMAKLKASGCDFVSISPLRDDTADFLSPEWLTPRPNTDTAMMLGMAHTLVSEGLHDRAFLASHCAGYDRFEDYLMGRSDGVPKSADWAAPICALSVDTIRGLARRMAGCRTMIMTSWSLQRGDHGEQPYWMTVTLACMLGQVGLPGGGFGFGYGSVSSMGNPRRKIPSPNLPMGTNDTGSYIPVARISDMLLDPGGSYEFNGELRKYPDIRVVYWAGGNPFHHHQDLNRLVAAFRKPETIIFHEPWWTASARYADIVLPATTTLERNDIGAGGRDRFIMAMHEAVPPVGDARSDHAIFSGLADRLGFAELFTEGRTEMEWLRHLYDVSRQLAARQKVEMPDFDTFWRDGHVEIPAPEEPYTMYADFRADPERAALDTPSGKIEIFSENVAGFGYDDCPGMPVWIEPGEWLGAPLAGKFPLHLMSNQPRTRLHGQLDNGRISRESKISGREPIWLNPADAAARDLRGGDIVRVFNDRGAVLAGVVVTDLVMPGVVQLATGAWFDPLEPAAANTLDKHGNANVLTPDKGTSRLGQGPSAHSCLVQIERWTHALPNITAFQQPATA